MKSNQCLNNSSQPLIVTNLTNEAIFHPDEEFGLIKVMWIGFLGLCQVINVVGKSCFIYYIRKYTPKNRSINKLLLKDQVIQLLSTTIFNGLFMLSVLLNKPLKEILGFSSCWLFMIVAPIQVISLALGGFGTAIFRMICIKSQQMSFNPSLADAYVKGIVIAEIITMLFLTSIPICGWYFFKSNNPMNFCMGHTPTYTQITTHLNHADWGGRATMFTTAFVAIFACIEVKYYIKLYKTLSEQEKKNSALTKEMKTWRHRRNTLTLKGQIITFIVIMLVVSIFSIFSAFQFTGVERTLVMGTSLTALSASVTICHFVVSPELRRHYFDSLY